MPDQTPEPHTDDELREIIEFGGGLVISEMVEQMAAELLDARARIAELEAFVGDIACHGLRADPNPTVNSAGDMYAQMTDYLRRINSGLRDRARALVPDANVPYSGGRPGAKLQPEPVAAEPDAYIAVKRYRSPNATGPEWDWHATVIPAGDEFAEDRDWRKDRGFDLLPIVGTETGTRPAAPPEGDLIGFVPATFLPADEQNPLPRLAAYHATAYGTAEEARAKLDELGPAYGLWRVIELREANRDSAPRPAPAGYAVVTRNSEGGLHRSATVWDSLDQANTAEGIASGYADGTGCTAALYALREVQQ